MSVDKKFKKLDDIDHVILRPGMYIGSIKPHKATKWIVEDDKMIQKEVTYNPGLLKIFDEIVTNSVDESKRAGSKLNTVKVNIDRATNYINIWDNGGIPVVKHTQHKEWIPEMIFSNLKSGSNFNDEEKRTGAGTNGVGSTLTNIYSKEFTVTTCDGANHFTQTFSNNMRKRTAPKTKKSTKGFTEIEYLVDFEKFALTGIDDDHFKMIEKRVYDIAACNTGLKIYFNGKLINIKSFDDYIKYYTNDFFSESKKDKTYEKYHSDWGDDYEEIGKRGNSKEEKEFRDQISNNDLPNYYEILGLKIDASAQEIKNNFRELAKKSHPDKTKKDSEKEMIEINKAYEILSDVEARKKYDKYI